MSKQAELFLYTRTACGLCELLASGLDQRGLVYHIIDVDTDPELRHRYGARVPVLVSGDREICEGQFDEQVLDQLVKPARVPA